MADKKDSELTVKGAIVDGDKIPLLDSETAVEGERNKTVEASTIKTYIGAVEMNVGDFTPTVLFSIPVLNAFAEWSRIGNMVFIQFLIEIDTNAIGSVLAISNMPYKPSESWAKGSCVAIDLSGGGTNRLFYSIEATGGSNSMGFAKETALAEGVKGVDASNKQITGSITYLTDDPK